MLAAVRVAQAARLAFLDRARRWRVELEADWRGYCHTKCGVIAIQSSNSGVKGARERTVGFSSGASKAGNSGALFSVPVVTTAGRGGMAISVGSGTSGSGGGVLSVLPGRIPVNTDGALMVESGEGTATASRVIAIG